MATSSSPVEVAVIGSARIGPGTPATTTPSGSARRWPTTAGPSSPAGTAALMGATASGAAAARGGHTVGCRCDLGSTWARRQPRRTAVERRLLPNECVTCCRPTSSSVCPAVSVPRPRPARVWAAVQTEPGSAGLVLVGADVGPPASTLRPSLVIDPADLALAHCVAAWTTWSPSSAICSIIPTAALGPRVALRSPSRPSRDQVWANRPSFPGRGRSRSGAPAGPRRSTPPRWSRRAGR